MLSPVSMHNTRATKATACTFNHNQSRARAIHMAKERRKMGIDDEEEKDAKVRIIQRQTLLQIKD
jgi:hypothetical protein